mgnify:CR=1 FL=1
MRRTDRAGIGITIVVNGVSTSPPLKQMEIIVITTSRIKVAAILTQFSIRRLDN